MLSGRSSYFPLGWARPPIEVPVILQDRLTATNETHFVLYLTIILNSINQTDIHERGYQVTQMRKIYEKAKAVLIWVGPDSEDQQAGVAISSINIISDFLCQKLGIPVSDLYSVENLYQEVMAASHDVLPMPNECDFSTEAMWTSLLLVL